MVKYLSRKFLQFCFNYSASFRIKFEFKVGDFMIRNASCTVSELDPEILGKDESSRAAGLLGAEYLGLHGAIFDLNSATLYLRPKK